MIGRLLWNLGNIILFVAALTRESEAAVVFGRYSIAYAAGIALCLALIMAVAVLTLVQAGRRQSDRWASKLLSRIPQRTVALGLIVIAVLAAGILLWSVPFDLGFLAICLLFNLVMAGVALVSRPLEPGTMPPIPSFALYWALLVLVLVVSFFSAHAVPQEQSSGDEVAWTNMASTWLDTGQAYIRVNGHLPTQISPGVGWWVAPYGLWLSVFGVSFSAGRLFFWVVYLVSVISIGWAGVRVYDRQTGLSAAILAAASLLALSYRIIRPEIGLAAIGALLLLTYMASQRRPAWAFVAGWLAILSMEIHAAGLAYIVALLVMYGLDGLLRVINRRNPVTWALVAMITGMGVGTLVYLALHILTQPDPATYVGFLRSTRSFLAGLPPLDWFVRSLATVWERAPVELLLTAIALVALIVRRSKGDRLVLRFFVATVLGYFLLVPEPFRYLVIFMPFIAWSIAALISYGFRAIAAPPRPEVSLLALAVLCIPFFSLSVTALSLNPMPATEESPVAMRVRELSTPDEVVVGDAFAFWGLTDYPAFYSSTAEYELTRGLSYSTGHELWSALQPDLVFHTYYPGFPEMPPALRDYIEEQLFELVDSFEWKTHLVEIYRRPAEP